MPTLIYERAIKRDPQTGDLVSYWPDHWPLDTLYATLLRNGSAFFAASYMNDPSALEGNSLKTAWLRPYLQSELQAARDLHKIDRGIRHIGFDPTLGGETGDPDYFALFCIEMIDNKGYAVDFHFDRRPVDQQAQICEDWADTLQPTLILAEDTAERGHVWTQLTSQINGGSGSKYPVEIRRPQSSRDEGGKKMRLQAVAARWQSGQIRLPGVVHPETGMVIIDSRWDDFVNQWRVFPAGHDDILDAAYWSAYDLFQDVIAGSVALSGRVPGPATPDGSVPGLKQPRRFGRIRNSESTGLILPNGRDIAAEMDHGDARGRYGLTRRLLTHRDDDFFTR